MNSEILKADRSNCIPEQIMSGMERERGNGKEIL